MTDNSVAVNNGSAVVTGTTTSFSGAQGDLFLLNGLGVLIQSVDSSSQITLQQPWPGANMTGQTNFAVRNDGPHWQSSVALNTQIAALLQKVQGGLPLAVNSAGTLAGRALYDAQPMGWTFLQVDVVPFVLFAKLSDTAGNWSAGNPIAGQPAVSTTQAIAAAALAQAWATQTGSEVVTGQGYGAKYYANAAAASQTSAASSATNSANSATASAASATSALGSWNNLQNTYYGGLTADPTLNPTGGAVRNGDMYTNTTSNVLRIRIGGLWGNIAVTTGDVLYSAAQSLTGPQQLQARSNILAAASGANTDITSLTGLTTALSVTQGGTGAATAAGARTALGLGGAAVLNVGTTTATVVAGDDSRITGALQKSGGTMTGALAINPVANQPQYVGNGWGHAGGTLGGAGYVSSNLYNDGVSGLWKIGATHGSLGYGLIQINSAGAFVSFGTGAVTANSTVTPTAYKLWSAADFNYTPQAALGYTPLNRSGDTIGGAVLMNSSGRLWYYGDLGAANSQSVISSATLTGVNSVGIASWAGAVGGWSAFQARVDRGDDYFMSFLWGASAFVGSISTNGTSTLYNTTSDARRKDNIRPLANEVDVGAVVDAIQPRVFEWNDLPDRPTDVGFVAQELVAVTPKVVSRGDDAPNKRPGDEGFLQWGVDASKLVPYLVAELQSLRKRVAELEAKNG
ncbi:Chaperone of endosialidase [Rhizobiales bacterium GAS188]|nr:Chaperone of endosialidase [Rhizobiales bacterium GAS188]